MDTNTLLGVLLVLTGLGDVAIARFMTSMAPQARQLLMIAGAVFVVFGLVVALGVVKVL